MAQRLVDLSAYLQMFETHLSFALLLTVVYTPLSQRIFYTVALPLREWLILLPLMALPFVAAELTKWGIRRRERLNPATI